MRTAKIDGLRQRLGLPDDALGDPRIVVAVLDGPADTSHPCFAGARLATLREPAGPPRAGAPAHGTYVASLLFGQPGSPVAGIVPRCTGLLVPIYGANGPRPACSPDDLAHAVMAALAAGADIVNVSGGQPIATLLAAAPRLAAAMATCAARGVLVFAAAGNDACACAHVPAALPGVIAVGAMDAGGAPLELSNWSALYRDRGLLALGAEIEGALPGGGTTRFSGTSAATAVASGIAALLLSEQLVRRGVSTAAAVREALFTSSIGCSSRPWPDCDRLLAGRLDAGGALHLIRNPRRRRSLMSDSATTPASVEESPAFALAPPPGRAFPDGAFPDRAFADGAFPAAAAPAFVPADASAAAPALAPAIAPVFAAAVVPGIAPAMCDECAHELGHHAPPPAPPAAPPQKAYALGQLTYDFGSRVRREAFLQAGLERPHEPGALLAFLDRFPTYAESLLWVLADDGQPLYTLRPEGAFAERTYERLRQLLGLQERRETERVSVPGWVRGSATLESGETLPLLAPEPRGTYGWTTAALLDAVLAAAPKADAKLLRSAVGGFLERIYYELRNQGLAPRDRALNFAATNAFQVGHVFSDAIRTGLVLDAIAAEPSPATRPGSDNWDVKLTFFDPGHRLERARRVYRFTIDVSDVVPVVVGGFKAWPVY